MARVKRSRQHNVTWSKDACLSGYDYFARKFGRAPSQKDWSRTGYDEAGVPVWPVHTTCKKYFGSWAKFRRAAEREFGLPENPKPEDIQRWIIGEKQVADLAADSEVPIRPEDRSNMDMILQMEDLRLQIRDLTNVCERLTNEIHGLREAQEDQVVATYEAQENGHAHGAGGFLRSLFATS